MTSDSRELHEQTKTLSSCSTLCCVDAGKCEFEGVAASAGVTGYGMNLVNKDVGERDACTHMQPRTN
jgi:hypothetical protein